MFYVVYAVALFIASVTAHILFCRYTPQPGLHTKVYGMIAGGFFIVYAAGAWTVQNWVLVDPNSLWGIPFIITAAVIFVLLIPFYLSFYVLTQLMSPSKKILLTVTKKGRLSDQEVVSCLEEEGFIATRLADLCTSGCVVDHQGRYVLTPAGRKIAGILNCMQRILGRGMGG